jgi:3-methyladenine DNA glycosylase AlkD
MPEFPIMTQLPQPGADPAQTHPASAAKAASTTDPASTTSPASTTDPVSRMAPASTTEPASFTDPGSAIEAADAIEAAGAIKAAGAIEAALRMAGIPERAVRERAYLKSELEFAGAPAGAVRGVIRGWCTARPGLTRAELLSVTAQLWGRPLFECRRAAVELLRARPGLLQPTDAAVVEAMLRTAGTWALVDDLAEHVAGSLAEAHPGLAATLDRWAGDGDFWIRRSALLALLGPLRRGEGDFARFGRYADSMLTERDFFIRKAIGWVLRDTARRRPELVAAWLAPRVHRASGVTMREAVKPLPPATRDALMAGYRDKHPVPRTG